MKLKYRCTIKLKHDILNRIKVIFKLILLLKIYLVMLHIKVKIVKLPEENVLKLTLHMLNFE